MKKEPKIFVIVVTYKGGRWYDKCFGSLQKSTLPVTAIAVDNASGDGSADYIREHFPEVIVMESGENLGFGRANNLGMKYALEHDCDYVFLLNQDAWLDADALEKLVSAAGNHPEFGVLCPLFIDANRTTIGITLTTQKIRNGEKLLADILLGGGLKDVYLNDYSIQAAGWLLTRRTLMEVGGFTPLIYHYGEDDDYMNRLKYHHILMAVVPSAYMVHDHQERLKNSEDLFVKSNRDVPEDYVNINDNRNARDFQRFYFLAAIRMLLHGDMSRMHLYWHRFQYIRVHKAQIDYCREQNKIKQPNWIQ